MEDPQPPQEEEQLMSEDFFYPPSYSKNRLADSPIPRHLASFYWCTGFDEAKKNNVQILSSTELILSIGSTYQIWDIKSGARKILFNSDGGGIGAISVHPEKRYFAIGEKGSWPNVYIYSYPDLRLYRVLRKGTERSFASISWSKDGDKLATVGSDPDFMLTVWDWKQERVILKSKAFGQEVYRVSFSPMYDQQITTSGTAHIRFWKMARTFTGLKLQGDIGKFGAVELSDINAFIELPDGKVLSSSEYGNLLLWEGGLIKAVLTKPDGSPCHVGGVEALLFEDDCFISAGNDGYLRWWTFQSVDMAEPNETVDVPIECIREVMVGDFAQITSIVKDAEKWVIVDGKGKLWSVSADFQEQTVLQDYHAGKIMDAVLAPGGNVLVTIGEDGTTRLWDFIHKREIYQQSWVGKGHSLAWAPENSHNLSRVIVAGFDNGIVRVLLLGSDNFKVIQAQKVHDTAVTRLEYSPDGTKFATTGNDGSLFFFTVKDDNTLEPVCITPKLDVIIRDMNWHSDSNRVILALSDGSVMEVNFPELSHIDSSASYEHECATRTWKIRMMEFQIEKPPPSDDFLKEPPKRPGEEEVIPEWGPAPITAVKYHPRKPDNFIIAAEAPYTGYVYVCSFDEDRPIKAIPCSQEKTTSLTASKRFLTTAHSDGSFELRTYKNPERKLDYRPHDCKARTRKVLLNESETYACSVAEDGTMFITELFPEHIIESAENGTQPAKPNIPKDEKGVEVLNLSGELEIKLGEDLTDASIYSIQMDKLMTDEDTKKRRAEEKKQQRRKEISRLRADFSTILQEQNVLDPKLRLSEVELCVDPEYRDMLLARNEELVEEAKKEVDWGLAFKEMEVSRYEEHFLSLVAIERFKLFALKNEHFLTSFRVTKQSDFLTMSLSKIQSMLEDEARGYGSDTESVFSPARQTNYTGDRESEGMEETKADFRITSNLAYKKPNKKTTQAQIDRETRASKRELRKKELLDHEKKKPSDTAYDPADIREIESAKKTVGDFKLKTSADYVVPEHLCLNAEKKRRQMIMLMESVRNLKVDFNSRMLGLRELKSRLIERISIYNQRIREVNTELAITEEIKDPEFNDEEWPERLYDFEDVCILREPTEQKVSPFKFGRKQPTETEKIFKAHSDSKLLYEKQALLAEIDKITKGFDEAIKKQSDEKNLLESDLKQTDMKLITCFQELIQLNLLEPKDQELTAKQRKLRGDMNATAVEMGEIARQYTVLEKEAEEITRKQSQIRGEFNELVPDNYPHREFLLGILEKKLKRRRQRKGSDDSDDDSNSESDMSDEDSGDSDEEGEICPSDCDTNLFEKVQALRDRKLELQEDAADKAQQMTDLNKRKNEVERKERSLGGQLEMNLREIQKFQREKMQMLNQLEVAIVLAMEQIQNLEEHRLPPELNLSVLFTQEEMGKLKRRIDELDSEVHETENRFERLKKLTQGTKRLNEQKARLKEEELKKYEAIQALKYGHTIDLDLLSHAEPTASLENLKEKFETAERESVRSIEEAKADLNATRDELNRMTIRNTQLIKKRRDLFVEIAKFSKQLDAGNEDVFKQEDVSEKVTLERERTKIKELIEMQTHEIETLKTEINLFRRKGGHIYTKITANRRTNMD
jgi:WD40 repeat protein